MAGWQGHRAHAIWLDEVLDTEAQVCLNGGMSNVTPKIDPQAWLYANVTPINALKDTVAAFTDDILVDMIEMLDIAADADERTVRAVACDEVQRRYPQVEVALDRWGDDDEDHRTMAQVLRHAMSAKRTPLTWHLNPRHGTTTHDWYGMVNGQRVVRVWEGMTGWRAKDEDNVLIGRAPTFDELATLVVAYFNRRGVNC